MSNGIQTIEKRLKQLVCNEVEIRVSKEGGNWIVAAYDCRLGFDTVQSALKFVDDYQTVLTDPLFWTEEQVASC